jgi:hypothetical protein
MKLTQTDFEKLVADVEKEFDSFLAKAESEAKPEVTLAKAEESEEDKSDEKKDAKEASEDAEDKKEDKKDDDKHDYDDEDMEEMHKMYSSMGKAERQLHKSAIEKCGDMMVAKSEEVTKEEPLTKSEDAQSLKKAEEEISLAKKELDGVKEENEKLKKNLEEVVSAMNGFLSKKGPQRKAITSIEYVKKSEIENTPEAKVLTKSEITAILNRKAADPSLSKSDREAIKTYYLKGASLEVVKHLLTQ